jgi:amino acid transporter
MTSLYSTFDITSQFIQSVLGEDTGVVRGVIALLVIPILITVIFLSYGFSIDPQMHRAIISAVSILVGFSLNAVLLLLRYGMNSDASNKLMRIVRHISIYSVLIGVIVVIVSLTSLLITQNMESSLITGFLSGVIFLSVSHYLLTVLLLPARVFVVVELAEK